MADSGPWEDFSASETDGPWADFQSPNTTPSTLDGVVKGAIDALPAAGSIVGGVLGTPMDAVSGPMGNVVGAGIGGYLGTAAKNLINRYYDPQSAPKNMTDVMTEPVTSGATQALAQGTGEAVAPYLAKGISAITSPISDALDSYAAQQAVASTGATGKQAAKFAPDAGQQLLDRGIVKFGDTQAKVAQKINDAITQAGENTGKVLTTLDERGATVDQADIVKSLRDRAAELGKDPSQYSVSDSLNRLADRIEVSAKASGGDSKIPLTQAENTKRGFQASANYNSSPADLSVSKEAASIYRQAVEDAATKFDPKSAEAFKAEKKAYSLLSPIDDAAQKRALTVQQSPHGGLMDTVAAGVGEGVAGIPGAIAGPLLRRAVSTRLAPAAAGAANAAGNMIGAVPAAAERAVPAALQAPASQVTGAIESAAPKFAPLPAAATAQGPSANRAPAKGEDLWASQGLQKLGIQDQGMSARLMNDPRAKQLLIQASNFTPGSKAMKRIQSQLQQGWGNR